MPAGLLLLSLCTAVQVPALLFFAVESNWWPGKVPPPLKSHLVDVGGVDEEEDESAGEGVGIFDHDVLA